MNKTSKYEIRYSVPTANDNWREKVIRFEGDERKRNNLAAIEKYGYRLISCEKLYPFSMGKNGHNIELAYNNQHIICDEMEMGERPWDDKAFDLLKEISDLYANAIGNLIYWCPYKEWLKLTELSAWAECHRDHVNALARENRNA